MTINPYEPSRVPEPFTAPMPPLPRRLEYDLNLEDLIEFNVSHQDRSPTVRGLAVGVFALAAVIVPAAVAVTLLRSPSANAGLQIVLFGWASLCCLVFGAVAAWSAWKGPPRLRSIAALLIRHQLTRGDTSALLGKYSLVLGPDEIVERGPKSEHRFALAAIQKVIHAPRHIYLYTSPVGAIVVPLRAFADGLEAGAFLAAVEKLSGVHPTAG